MILKCRRVGEFHIRLTFLKKKTYLIVLKDENGLKSKLNSSTLIMIGSYVQKLVALYLKKEEMTLS